MTARKPHNPYGIRSRPSWVECTLGELVADGPSFIQTGPFGSQLHAHDYKEEGIPVVMPQQLGDNVIDFSEIARISEADRDRLSRHVMEEGDIVFSRRGDVTRRALITAETAGCLCGTGCLLIRLKHPKVDNRFLALFLSLPAFKSYITQKAVGATMPNLNTGILERIPLVLPPHDVQVGIVTVLARYSSSIDNNHRRIMLLERAASQLYREWFIRLRFPGREHARVKGRLPDGWKPSTFGDLCEEIRESVSPEAMEPDTPYIGLEHIPRRSISLSEWGSVEEVTSSKHRYREGDILFGKIRPYFHKVGIAFTDGVASSDAIVIRPKDAKLLPLVLMTASSDPFVATTSQTMREGSKMPRADWKQMQAYPAPTPPDGLLQSFNDFINPILAQLKTLALMNRRLKAARDLLLPKLMSGEVAV